MKRVRNSLFIVVFPFFLLSCRYNPQGVDPLSVQLYWSFEADQRAPFPESFHVQKGGVFAEHINELLEKNTHGWRPSIANYVPYIQVVSEDRMYVLNITPWLLVINYKENESVVLMTQRVKKIPNGVYVETLNIIKNQSGVKPEEDHF